MKKLCCPKNAALRRQETNLRPVVRSETIWWSIFAIIKRYFELKPHLRQG